MANEHAEGMMSLWFEGRGDEWHVHLQLFMSPRPLSGKGNALFGG